MILGGAAVLGGVLVGGSGTALIIGGLVCAGYGRCIYTQETRARARAAGRGPA